MTEEESPGPFFVTFDELQAKDSLVVIAFPSLGQAAGIAAEYIRKSQNLPLRGFAWWSDHPPLAQVSMGIPTTPITVHGGEIDCGPDGECTNLLMFLSPVPLPKEHAQGICDAILSIAQDAKMIICLDSIGRAADDHQPDVYYLGGSEKLREELAKLEIQPLDRAMLSGTTAYMTLKGSLLELPVGSMLVEANPEIPDHFAAIELVKVLDRIIPRTALDSSPLLEEAKKIHDQLSEMERQTETGGREHHNFI